MQLMKDHHGNVKTLEIIPIPDQGPIQLKAQTEHEETWTIGELDRLQRMPHRADRQLLHPP